MLKGLDPSQQLFQNSNEKINIHICFKVFLVVFKKMAVVKRSDITMMSPSVIIVIGFVLTTICYGQLEEIDKTDGSSTFEAAFQGNLLNSFLFPSKQRREQRQHKHKFKRHSHMCRVITDIGYLLPLLLCLFVYPQNPNSKAIQQNPNPFSLRNNDKSLCKSTK